MVSIGTQTFGVIGPSPLIYISTSKKFCRLKYFVVIVHAVVTDLPKYFATENLWFGILKIVTFYITGCLIHKLLS